MNSWWFSFYRWLRPTNSNESGQLIFRTATQNSNTYGQLIFKTATQNSNTYGQLIFKSVETEQQQIWTADF